MKVGRMMIPNPFCAHLMNILGFFAISVSQREVYNTSRWHADIYGENKQETNYSHIWKLI